METLDSSEPLDTALNPPQLATDSCAPSARQKRPDVKLSSSVPMEAHAKALGDMLQAGLTELHIYSLIETQEAYRELCAHERWVPHRWDALAAKLRRYLGIDKLYEESFRKSDGDLGRGPVEYRVPPRVTVDAWAAAHLARQATASVDRWVHRPQRPLAPGMQRFAKAQQRQAEPRDPEIMQATQATVSPASSPLSATATRASIKIAPPAVVQHDPRPLFQQAA